MKTVTLSKNLTTQRKEKEEEKGNNFYIVILLAFLSSIIFIDSPLCKPTQRTIISAMTLKPQPLPCRFLYVGFCSLPPVWHREPPPLEHGASLLTFGAFISRPRNPYCCITDLSSCNHYYVFSPTVKLLKVKIDSQIKKVWNPIS